MSRDVAFLAPCSTLIGSVYIGAGSSVFYKSILRADSCDNAGVFAKSEEEFENTTLEDHVWSLEENRAAGSSGGGIFIGQDTNIQDGCIIDATKNHTRIGSGVTVGHLASIHSATIEDHCLIGMGSLIQEGAVIKEESFIAAGANVTKNTVVESGELWVGNPARKLRDLTSTERQRLHYQANEVRTDVLACSLVDERSSDLSIVVQEHLVVLASHILSLPLAKTSTLSFIVRTVCCCS